MTCSFDFEEPCVQPYLRAINIFGYNVSLYGANVFEKFER
jgi:hypothetical protein